MDNNEIYSSPEETAVVPVDNNKKGFAIAILVLGIVSDALILLCCCGNIPRIISLTCAIVGIVLYVVNKKDIGAGVSKMAKAGFICSIVGASVSGLFVLTGIVLFILNTVLNIGFSSLSFLDSFY